MALYFEAAEMRESHMKDEVQGLNCNGSSQYLSLIKKT